MTMSYASSRPVKLGKRVFPPITWTFCVGGQGKEREGEGGA